MANLNVHSIKVSQVVFFPFKIAADSKIHRKIVHIVKIKKKRKLHGYKTVQLKNTFPTK